MYGTRPLFVWHSSYVTFYFLLQIKLQALIIMKILQKRFNSFSGDVYVQLQTSALTVYSAVFQDSPHQVIRFRERQK